MISVLIITKNEETNLPGCLDSLHWSDDIIVFDSFSSDTTLDVAKKFGARIYQREFDNYANQRNAALKGDFKWPWVFLIDADERVPTSLAEEMRMFVETDDGTYSACRVRRNDYFLGTHLHHSQISPFFIRLVRPEKIGFERVVNEFMLVDGKINDLSCNLEHFPFSKGISSWFEKHNTYSDFEAQILASSVEVTSINFRKLFDGDFNLRRVEQKKLFYKLPCRPWIKLFYMLFIRGGVLDGKAGIRYAVLQSFYEYMISLKAEEITDLKSSPEYRFKK